MIRCTICFIFIITLCSSIAAQQIDSSYQEVAPPMDPTELAAKYYGIDFSPEIRRSINDVLLELIFVISQEGNPTLSEVNGTSHSAVLDSFRLRTQQIGQFSPRVRNGIPEKSIYFLQIAYPAYSTGLGANQYSYMQSYRQTDIDDFEELTLSGRQIDYNLGLLTNRFLGTPSEYLSMGGGMKVDVHATGRDQMSYGIIMNFYFNKRQLDYPLDTRRTQFSSTPSMIVGLSAGRWLGSFLVQAEVGYTIQNITERIDVDDPEWIQLRGWSPGLVLHYPVTIAKDKPIYYFDTPSIRRHAINLHLGARYMDLSLSQATGIMLEFGVSYRGALESVSSYKLK